mmetsp:Transcript_50087/g.108548  ORF Transcript_50087/g.108548 Transcript_50087/m.108548 type:complete len:300 (-) Transcript_50087:65-964(-)
MGSDDESGGLDLSVFSFADDDDDDEKVSGPAPPASREAVLKAHRQEEQALRTQHKAIRQSIPKGDRAEREKAEASLDAALRDMYARHANELSPFSAEEKASEALSSLSVSCSSKSSKQSKRRQKKASEEQEREKRIAEEKAASGPSARAVETERLMAKLEPLGLAVQEVPADGHCLYRSVADQLQRSGDAADFQQCRRLAAEYIRTHPDDFMPYLPGEAGATTIDAYCAQVESSSEWGGQLEITALSHACRRCVAVYSADGPPLLTGEQYAGAPLTLAYHRHYFGLGEHYNSLVRVDER